MQYYIGIDGGGTKTALCAVSQDLSITLHSQTTSASWREYGVEPVVRGLKDAVSVLLRDQGGQAAGIAMGLPCYGESAEGDQLLRNEITRAFPGLPTYLANDVEVGWAGSLAMEPGINVVAGTGSIAYGKDAAGHGARSGGWDEFYSDEGSCYWMGRQMLGLFCKQADGRAERGPLYRIVRREFGLREDIDFIDYVRTRYLSSREDVAKLQILLEKAALEGDKDAKALYHQAAGELCQLALAVKHRLDFPERGWAVSCSGGLFKAGELILPLFREMLENRGARLSSPRCTPAQGAALLAFHHFLPSAMTGVKTLLSRTG